MLMQLPRWVDFFFFFLTEYEKIKVHKAKQVDRDSLLLQLRDLRTAVGRVGELEGHVTSLKTTNTCLETTLEEAAAEIAKIKENLEDRQYYSIHIFWPK